MTAIDDIYPCKKPRRSTRLEVKEKEERVVLNTVYGPLGYFKLLPLEIKFHILSHLQLEDLSVLTITSKELRNVVELYRTTPWTQRFIIPKHVQHSKEISLEESSLYLTQFRKLGLLMKRSTCLYATKDRLRFVISCLQKYLCTIHSCHMPAKCISLKCFGKFLHTVIAGWDDKECIKMLDAICSATLMNRNLENVLHNKPGKKRVLELHVRLFFRRVFLNHCTCHMDKAFWIQQILKSLPMVHQARALFLLFGPVVNDEVQWYEMCESTPVNKEQARVCFGDLAQAFSVLHTHSKQWSEDDIISVMEELTSFPDEWLAENVAHLLYLCGDAITLKVLHSKAINGRLTELASIITSLSLVCVRHKHNLDWVMNLVGQVSLIFDYPKQRVNFLYAIIDMFKEMIMDIHEFDDDSPDYLQHMLDAQSAFTKHLALRSLKSEMLVNPHAKPAPYPRHPPRTEE